MLKFMFHNDSFIMQIVIIIIQVDCFLIHIIYISAQQNPNEPLLD